MKEYIKVVICGLVTGACLMQFINMAVQSWLERPISMGGELLLPALLGMVGYMGWQISAYYFNKVRHKEIYQKGFEDGMKIHSYRIIIPLEEDEHYEPVSNRIA